jgi:hypothetical protein
VLRISTEGAALLSRKLSSLEKRQLPFATATALNKTAALVERAEVEAMKAVFDRPTRWTLNSLFIRYAKKGRLEARVWVKDYASKGQPPTRWLLPEVMGGRRKHKGSEGLLAARGILPAGQFLMPGKGMKLDASGNVSRGRMQKILSGLGAQRDKYSNSTGSRRSQANSKRFFVLGKGANAVGIAERTGKKRGSVNMLFAFGKDPSYSSLLDFFGIANREVHTHLPVEGEKAMTAAVLSAK